MKISQSRVSIVIRLLALVSGSVALFSYFGDKSVAEQHEFMIGYFVGWGLTLAGPICEAMAKVITRAIQAGDGGTDK